MPINSRRHRKRDNKSRRTRKNKTRRRYKKTMRGGMPAGLIIKNETELEESWNKKDGDRFLIQAWEADDGRGTRERYLREGYTYEQLKKSLTYFLRMMMANEADTKRREDEKGFIVGIYY